MIGEKGGNVFFFWGKTGNLLKSKLGSLDCFFKTLMLLRGRLKHRKFNKPRIKKLNKKTGNYLLRHEKFHKLIEKEENLETKKVMKRKQKF
jgi:hypothetical protein